MLDGVAQLTDLLVGRAGYSSVVAAVAEHAVFLHPATVEQTGGSALFATIRLRDISDRGSVQEVEGRRVLLDDNTSPTDAFLWAGGIPRSRCREVQFNHVWTAARDPDAYTALWNVCATPAFLAKTTDGNNHPEVIAALRYRAYDLYGRVPADMSVPSKPDGYDELRWAAHPSPLEDLPATFRARLQRAPKSRTTKACREIGWLYSDWRPDTAL